MKLTSSNRVDQDRVADLLKSTDEPDGSLVGMVTIELINAEVAPFGAVEQHVPRGGGHRGGPAARDDDTRGASSTSPLGGLGEATGVGASVAPVSVGPFDGSLGHPFRKGVVGSDLRASQPRYASNLLNGAAPRGSTHIIQRRMKNLLS